MPWIVCEVCQEEEFRTAKTPCSYCAGTAQPLNGEDVKFTSTAVDFESPKKPKITPVSARKPATLDDLVAAQNRTTHSIRALVRFLFIQFSASLLAGVFIGFAFIFDKEFLNLLALGILFGGLIASSIAGWNELQKSKVS